MVQSLCCALVNRCWLLSGDWMHSPSQSLCVASVVEILRLCLGVVGLHRPAPVVDVSPVAWMVVVMHLLQV